MSTPSRTVLVLALLLPALARAERFSDPAAGFAVDVPAGFVADAEISKLLEQTPHFGGLAVATGGRSHLTKERGAVFHVSWAVTRDAAADPGHAARAEIDRFRDVGVAGEWAEEPGERLVVGRRAYRRPAEETASRARIVVFLDPARRLHSVVAECVVADDAPADVRDRCNAAVNTLAVLFPESDRPTFQLAAAVVIPDAGPLVSGATMSPPGETGPLPPTPPPPRRQLPPWLVWGGGGLVLVLAVLFLLRRRAA